MADRVRKINYCYAKVSTRAGQGAAMLSKLRDARVNLLAFSGFPIGGGKAQLDFVSDDMAGVRRVPARRAGASARRRRGSSCREATNSGPVTGSSRSSRTSGSASPRLTRWRPAGNATACSCG